MNTFMELSSCSYCGERYFATSKPLCKKCLARAEMECCEEYKKNDPNTAGVLSKCTQCSEAYLGNELKGGLCLNCILDNIMFTHSIGGGG